MHAFQIWTLISSGLLLLLAFRTFRFTKHLISLGELPVGKKDHWPLVSLVIPACNEAQTIEAAMGSLLKIDYPNLEIVVVNDRSNDETRQIVDLLSLQDERIKAVHVNYLPEGWLGKVNALERGVGMTNGEWVLISDADVHFAPDAFRRAVNHCVSENVDFMTIIPDVVSRSAILHTIIAQLFHQASLFFRPDKINDPKHRACYGQGAFMLVRKSTYLHSKRLEWLKMEVVDDTGFALLMRLAGAKMAAVAGKGHVWLEWYPSFKAFNRGIEKNAFAFSQYSLPILIGFQLVVYAVVFGFTAAPILSGGLALPLAAVSCLAIYLFSIHRQLRRILNLRAWTVFALPVASAILPILFLRASLMTLFRGGINWRGTFYDLRDLKSNQRMKLANLVLIEKGRSE